MKVKHFMVIVIVFAIAGGCTKDTVKPRVIPVIPAAPTTLSGDLQPVFTSNCALSGCHAGDQDPDLSAGVAYSSLMNGGYVDTANPDTSKIYLKLNSGSMAVNSYPAFTSKVLQWITEGAKNN